MEASRCSYPTHVQVTIKVIIKAPAGLLCFGSSAMEAAGCLSKLLPWSKHRQGNNIAANLQAYTKAALPDCLARWRLDTLLSVISALLCLQTITCYAGMSPLNMQWQG